MSRFSALSLLIAAYLLCPVGAAHALEPTAEGEPTFNRPSYQQLRFNEDWSGLASLDHSATGDFFDPIKYVPLTPSKDIWASFGGQARLRLEAWNNFNFGAPPGADHDDVFLLTRLRFHGDLHIGEHVRIFLEGKSAFSTERDLVGGRRTIDVDELALQNGFVDLILPFDEPGNRLTLRAGRQELLLGRQRLVSPLDWANTRRTFDGFSGILELQGWKVTAFWTQLVEVRKYDWNRGDAHTNLYGVYAAGTIPATPIGIDLYWLGLDRDDPVTFLTATGSERRHTLGGRLHGRCGTTGIDYDIEGAYQLGEVGDADVDAFMVAAQVGYQPADVVLSPRFFVGFDYASGGGSDGRINTFHQLFPLAHAFFGYVDVVARQNVIAPHVGVSVKPIDRLTVELTGHGFWRADRGDGLYNVGGAVLRPGGASDAREIGAEIDLLARYQVDRHLELQIGYSRFFTGRFIRETGPSRDIDFFYSGLQYTF